MNTLESMSNMSFVDLGTSLYICADASSRALLSQRADVRVFEQLDGKPISLPSALVCRTEDLSDEGSPVRRFVDELVRRRSET